MEHAPAVETAETAEEWERRRKGKGVMTELHHEAHNDDAQGQDPIISGSGSCEPMNVDDLQGDKERSSSSADSKANQEDALGRSKEKLILISASNSQDEDMGGEGGRVDRRESRKEEDEEKKPLVRLDGPSQEEARMAMEVARRAKGPGDKPRSEEGSRGTSGPPGYARRTRTQAGASSPFGKLQRGGFKFLKRPASSASSGQKQDTAVGAKKTKPISTMGDKDIAEVARNVGVDKELTEEQIRRLKDLERDRASS